MSPILAAMLKNHFGIVDYLINLDSIDANFQDDDGRSLISQLCMNINQDSYKNLQFIISKKKINVRQRDLFGHNPLHYLAMSNLHQLAQEYVGSSQEKKQEESFRYIRKKGKLIKKKRRGYGIQQYYRDKSLIGFFSDEKLQAEFKNNLQILQKVVIQCAELLYKEGVSLNDETEKNHMTPLNHAIKDKNYTLAEWILQKDPKSFKIQETDNILHHFASQFYLYEDNELLQKLVKENKKELQKLVYQRNNIGMTPYLSYFAEFLFFLSQLQSYNNYSAQAVEYINKVIIPRSIKSLKIVTEIYSKELNYDLSEIVGFSKGTIDSLKVLIQTNVITEEDFQKVANLTYQNKEQQSDEKMQIDQENKLNFEYDDIVYFDPIKSKYGLLSNKNKDSKSKRQITGQMKYIAKLGARQNYHQISNIEDDFDVDMFYRVVNNIMSNPLHYILYFLSYLNEKTQEEILEVFTDILKASKATKSKVQKNDVINKEGFSNFNYKEKENILSMAIRLEKFSFIKAIIDSDQVDIKLTDRTNNQNVLHQMSGINNKEIIDHMFKFTDRKLINQRDKNENSPLHYACQQRNQYLIEKLIENGAEINARNKFDFTPLHISLAFYRDSADHTPQIERMLIKARADLNAKDVDLATPIFHLFKQFSKQIHQQSTDPVNMVMVLLNSNQIDINVEDKFRNTVLQYACARGSTISTLTMINNGADIKTVNIQGNTPFQTALLSKRSDLCIFLIQNNCNIKSQVFDIEEKIYDKDLEELENAVLPEHIYDKYFVAKLDFQTLDEYLEENYKQKSKSIFTFAYKNNFKNIGYLLLSKNYDNFEALVGCLESLQFESFNDLLITVPKENLQKKDKKGRNLLMILIKSLAKVSKDKENERGMEMIKKLIEEFKLQADQTDIYSQNIFHYAGKHENNQLFTQLCSLFPNQNVLKKLLEQIDTKLKLPAIFLAFNKQFFANNLGLPQIIQPLSQFKITYIHYPVKSEQYDFKDIYILQKADFPLQTPMKQFESTVLHYIVRKIAYENIQVKKCDLFTTLKQMGLDLALKEKDSKLNILMLALMLNAKDIVQFLLGYQQNLQTLKLEKAEKPHIDVNLVDSQNRNVFYYAIKPSKLGTWQNLEMIEFLLQNEANPSSLDKNGENALDYSINNPNIYWKIIQYLPTAKPNKNKPLKREEIPFQQEIKDLDSMQFLPNDRIQSYEKDADELIKKKIKEKQDQKMEIDGKEKDKTDEPPYVDKNVNLENVVVLRADNEKEYAYDALLRKVDVKKWLYGFNAFYIMQILFDKVKNIYILFTKWGHNKDNNYFQNQKTPFNDKEQAIKEFKKVFKQKTGTNWDDFETSQRVKGKYKVKRIGGNYLFVNKNSNSWQKSERDINIKDLIVKFENFKLLPSKLPKSHLEFIKPLISQAVLLRVLKDNAYSEDLTIQTILDREVLLQMQEILAKIRTLSQKQTQIRNNATAQNKQANFDEVERYMNEQSELTSEYYELSDSQIVKDGTMQLLEQYSINNERTKIKLMYDIEHVTKLLLGAQYRINEINPYDYCFNSLNFKLQQLDVEEDRFKLIVKYFNQSIIQNVGYSQYKKQRLVISNIFQIDKDKKVKKQDELEDDNLFNDIHNHFMLFHGSQNSNILSIIEQGLQIQPFNSQGNQGSAFGRGIYFADQASLSLNVINITKSNILQYTSYSMQHEKDFYMCLCEVALGNVCNAQNVRTPIQIISKSQFQEEEKNHAEFFKNYQSLRIMGTYGPNFNHNLVRPDGTIWPIGSSVQYESPVYKLDDKRKFTKYNDFQKQKKESLKNLEQSKEEEKKKSPSKIKKGKNAKKKNIKDKTDDIEMIDTTTKKQSTEEVQDDKVEQDIQVQSNKDEIYKIDDDSVKNYVLEPNVLSYKKVRPNEQNYDIHYTLTQSEYVIFNPNQVRVRYIIQIRALNDDE